ncbi:hypothetical protein GF402_04145 [Candidatus Fermentibacteria bacterium]|nr:hypothetical protein [Candidatus Fermentibacteria bacterium]
MSYRWIIPATCILLTLLGCGQTGEECAEIQSDVTLIPVDSIGREMGDSNYVFGMINTADFTSEGNLVAADLLRMRILMYSPEGEFMHSGGSRGEGPGQFGSPTGMFPTPDGGVAVSDRNGAKIIFYDSCLHLKRELGGFLPYPPNQLMVLDDGSIVGTRFSFNRAEGDIANALQRWEQGETEPSITYREVAGEIVPGNFQKTFQQVAMDFDVFSDGRVVVSPASTEEYILECYDPQGELLWRRDLPFDKCRVPEEELELQRDLIRQNLRRSGRNPEMADEFELEEWALAVIDLQVVGDEEIWVRRGHTVVPLFDVFDDQGELQYNCTVPDLPYGRGVGFAISEHGVLAYLAQPEVYAKLYILEKE